ncbi:Nucleotidyl transferase domain [Trinorchestia longiramus]|nr:Nucleotidyl transferase domain [Trinorchestia longiramus]
MDIKPHTASSCMMGRGLDFHKYGKLKAVQAVVLAAGSGSRMTTLVSSTPKCMLPIASIPMLYYPLYMLQSSGFKECIVVVSCGQEAAVMEMAESHGLTIQLRLYSDSEQDRGTLDSLRHIANAFTDDVDDVIIVSSDLVSDVSVEDLLTHHRCSKSALTMLTAPLNSKAYVNTPGQKLKSDIDPDILLESVAERRLCGSYSGGDYGEYISIPYRILRHGQIIFSKGIVDAHAYVMGAKLFREYVLSDSSPCVRMASLKAEAIPHLVAMQFKTNRPPEYDNAIARVPEPFSSLPMRSSIGCYGLESQHWVASACRAYHYAEGLCVRANTIPAYWYLNTKARDHC